MNQRPHHARNAALVVAIAAILLLGGCPKPPDAPVTPRGPSQAIKDAVVACTTGTVDPKGAQVAYQFDWGDNSQSAWSDLLDDREVWTDTHTFTATGSHDVRARTRNAQGKTSTWSDPLTIYVNPSEGGIRWSFGYAPEDPEDSADFSTATFAIGPDSTVYVPAADYPALMSRRPTGSRRWEYVTPLEDAFACAPTIGADGTIYVGTDGGALLAINPNGTLKWQAPLSGDVIRAAALGLDDVVYVQTEGDTLWALDPANGSRLWVFYAGGGEVEPVVGPDGTIYTAQQDTLFALEPFGGTIKWRCPLDLPAVGAPAIDVGRNAIYLATDDGRLFSIDLGDGSVNWTAAGVVEVPSSPVIAQDGSILTFGFGRLQCLNPATGGLIWEFDPPFYGIGSTPAASRDGITYVLVCAGRKDSGDEDTLYAVGPAGQRRWACGLGTGIADEVMSAPKIDDFGYVYVGSGLRAWCVVGLGGPATSSWPMYMRDVRNSGRAR
ncbi:MAG: PQQ-binding-like beta-propeller repeat protein [candidate division WOR-3 bacterium]